MKILMVHAKPCTRAHKQARALRKRGHTVDLAFMMGGAQLRRSPRNIYWMLWDHAAEDYCGFFGTDKAEAEKIRDHINEQKYGEHYDRIVNMYDTGAFGLLELIPGYDIVHSHNTPDTYTAACIGARNSTGVPVIHDAHDVYMAYNVRKDRDVEHTRLMDEMLTLSADGFLFTSEGQKKLIEDRYSLKLRNASVLHCFTSEDHLPGPDVVRERPWPDDEVHVVYEGGVWLSENHERNFLGIWSRLMQKGIHVHVFPAGHMRHLEDLGNKAEKFHYHMPVNTKDIVSEMAKYDFDGGLLLYNLDTDVADMDIYSTCMPNKLFEYLAAGIAPIVDWECMYAATWCANNLGAGWAREDDLLDAKRMAFAKNAARSIDVQEITMERHIDVTLGVYDKAMANEGEISHARERVGGRLPLPRGEPVPA